jgi:hypothetical protein
MTVSFILTSDEWNFALGGAGDIGIIRSLVDKGLMSETLEFTPALKLLADEAKDAAREDAGRGYALRGKRFVLLIEPSAFNPANLRVQALKDDSALAAELAKRKETDDGATVS